VRNRSTSRSTSRPISPPERAFVDHRRGEIGVRTWPRRTDPRCRRCLPAPLWQRAALRADADGRSIELRVGGHVGFALIESVAVDPRRTGQGGGFRPSTRSESFDRRSTVGRATSRCDFLGRVQQRSGRITQGGGGARTARHCVYRAVRWACSRSSLPHMNVFFCSSLYPFEYIASSACAVNVFSTHVQSA
jgi:hypothetical protein